MCSEFLLRRLNSYPQPRRWIDRDNCRPIEEMVVPLHTRRVISPALEPRTDGLTAGGERHATPWFPLVLPLEPRRIRSGRSHRPASEAPHSAAFNFAAVFGASKTSAGRNTCDTRPQGLFHITALRTHSAFLKSELINHGLFCLYSRKLKPHAVTMLK